PATTSTKKGIWNPDVQGQSRGHCLRESFRRSPSALGPAVARTHQTLLHHRRHELALAGIDRTPVEAARARRTRRILRIEQPVVHLEAVVEPHGVIEARHLD